MQKRDALQSDYVKHTRNARDGKRGVNKRDRKVAKRNLQREHSREKA